MGAHRHHWSVIGFAFEGDRPVMRQSCVDCRQVRTVPAWDRTWAPPAEWRLVAGGRGAVTGRLLRPVHPAFLAGLNGDGAPMTQPDRIQIDAWSDIACPWCYIGKRNLEAGIAAHRAAGHAEPVEVIYHAFELAPDTPMDFDGGEIDYLARIKGIGHAHAQQMLDRVTRIAAGAGLRYDFASVRHTRTVKAHQVLHLARTRGLQVEAVERLFSAYFVEGRHIGRDEELADLAAEVGLDREEVLRVLAADAYLDAVREDQERARATGIHGVPFYVLDGRYGLSGAQPAETFAEALRMIVAEHVSEDPRREEAVRPQ